MGEGISYDRATFHAYNVVMKLSIYITITEKVHNIVHPF